MAAPGRGQRWAVALRYLVAPRGTILAVYNIRFAHIVARAAWHFTHGAVSWDPFQGVW